MTAEQKPEPGKPLGVAVTTVAGKFPNEDDYRRARANEKIESLLDVVKREQRLTNTEDWVVRVQPDGREVDAQQTFDEANLSCIVELDWHKREGGGGS